MSNVMRALKALCIGLCVLVAIVLVNLVSYGIYIHYDKQNDDQAYEQFRDLGGKGHYNWDIVEKYVFSTPGCGSDYSYEYYINALEKIGDTDNFEWNLVGFHMCCQEEMKNCKLKKMYD